MNYVLVLPAFVIGVVQFVLKRVFFTTLRTQGGLQKLWERCDVVKITASLIFVQHRADKNNKFTDIKDKFVFGHKKIQKNL